MTNYRYILLSLLMATLLLSNKVDNLLTIQSIIDNKAQLIFKIEANDFETSQAKQPLNLIGLPVYNFILEVPQDLELELDYSTKGVINISNQSEKEPFR